MAATTYLSKSDLFLLVPTLCLFPGVKGLTLASTFSVDGDFFLDSLIFCFCAFWSSDLGVCGVSNSLKARSLRWGGEIDLGEKSHSPGTCCSSSSISSKERVTATGDILRGLVIRLLGLGLGTGDGDGKSTSRKSEGCSANGVDVCRLVSSKSSYVRVFMIHPSSRRSIDRRLRFSLGLTQDIITDI